jgi:two-component system LytT family response regulator
MTAVLAVVIADDEPLARRLVRQLMTGIAGVQVAAECASGDELASTLAGERVDVVLLDVHMPGRDVFDILEERASVAPGEMPAVVFTTAYERYAVRAFELNAADYLVKPLTAERFGAAMARARQRAADRVTAAGLVRRVAGDLGSHPSRLLVPERGRMVPIEVAAVDWIQAEGDYARLHAGGKSYLVARGLSDLERRLDSDIFMRIHRSAIVNADRIVDVTPEGSSRYSVRLTDGTRLIVSRSRADRLRRWKV